MKKYLVLLIAIFFFCGLSVAKAEIADFEALPFDPNFSYWNGSDDTGGFIDGNAYFVNNNYGGWWDGFAYSKMTDTNTPGSPNQYSAYTGEGVNGSSTYVVSCNALDWQNQTYDIIPNRVTFSDTIEGYSVSGVYVTNATYAALAMLNGEDPARKFGDDPNTPETEESYPDWFKLSIVGIRADNSKTDVIEFYLADYRFSDDSQDYIVDEWTWIDLRDLGDVSALEFSVSSSDIGDWGINTPSYFCMDDLNGDPPSSSTLVKDGNAIDEKDDGLFGCFIDTLRFIDQ